MGVYPRACGGTRTESEVAIWIAGLSPRVRGNHPAVVVGRLVDGSIPARAGEPWSPPTRARSRQVYPRACGGTGDHLGPGCVARGLSPRVRGNLVSQKPPTIWVGSIPARAGEPADARDARLIGGSIPARAGEPAQALSRPGPYAVYPRACGGTFFRAESALGVLGLSPRVRGNRLVNQPLHRSPGSIPARAGEPRQP